MSSAVKKQQIFMKKTGDYSFIKNVIEQWPVRIRRAKLNQRKVATLAKLSEQSLSEIINFKTENPKLSSIERVEKVLQSKGV